MDTAPKRYCARAFPAYRYRPGLPHPMRDPAGHSYRAPGSLREEAHGEMDFAEWKGSEAYLFGVDLFNERYWWEAHEEWEGLWMGTTEPVQRGFLQGMIQIAAMHLRIDAGEREGVERLLQRAGKNWEGALQTCGQGARLGGVDLHAWWDATVAYQRACLARATVGHLPEGFPFIVLDGA